MTPPIRIIPGLIRPAPTIASLTFDKGTVIGQGQGMNSIVYLARDQQLDTQLAMKEVAKIKLPLASDYFAEARRLYDARHKHVVEVKYACEDQDNIYLAMPYYRAGSLQSLLERRYLSVREIVRYGLEFMAGLHHVHVKGLVHLDIKPSNILFDDSDTATLADFGLCREVTTQGLTDLPRAYRRHLPPERLAGPNAQVSKQADVYQAGLTLYRMCVGVAEFNRQVVMHGIDTHLGAIAAGHFPDRTRFLPHIPRRLRKVVRTAIEIDLSKRYTSVLDLLNALALVDESLDWLYHDAGAWGEGTWRESGNAGGRKVSVVSRSAGWEVHACRVTPTGQERRATAFCQAGLSEARAKVLLERALRESWS
jgi:eukaryotic-like serine/threonine-protein kinase